jgi:hypothetical protein
MMLSEFQKWLNDRGASLVVDGQAGPATRSAIMHVFANTSAPAITSNEIANIAENIGIPERNLRAISLVESGGSGFDNSGRPKILFERHYFHRLTNGRWSPSSFSQASGGGYKESSWDKLCRAACLHPLHAFASASWGKFQIMGSHANSLGYDSPLVFAYTMTRSEKAHYEALAAFIKTNRLDNEARAISTNPEACRAFAKAYNGPAYAKFSYHQKLAKAMK